MPSYRICAAATKNSESTPTPHCGSPRPSPNSAERSDTCPARAQRVRLSRNATEPSDAGADCGDHSGELVARHVGQLDSGVVAAPSVPVTAAQTGCLDRHDDASCPGSRVGRVAQLGKLT